MIRLISLLPRKQGWTHDEFLHHWHHVHGPLLAATAAGSHVLRYEQHAVAWPVAGRPEPSFDGVTVQWFASVEDFWASLAEPDNAQVMADAERFLDMDRLQWVLTEEPIVVVDRRGSG